MYGMNSESMGERERGGAFYNPGDGSQVSQAKLEKLFFFAFFAFLTHVFSVEKLKIRDRH